MDLSASTPRLIRFGVFELDLRSGDLRKAGARLNLPAQPLQFLTALLERPGELVTRDELRQRLWADDTFVDFEHGLNAAVKRLRDTLGDAADTPRFIETVPRRGYRFIAPVSRDDQRSESLHLPERTERERTDEPPPLDSPARGRGVQPLASTDVGPTPNSRQTPISPDGIGHVARQLRMTVAATSLLAALVVVLAAIVTAAIFTRSRSSVSDPVRFAIEPPQDARFTTTLALSPDGGRLVFGVLDAHGEDQLWVRSLDALESRALPGTEGGISPFWSPDGRHLGFFAHGRIKTIDVLGGPPETLCDCAPSPRGGSWNREGVIIFAPDSRSALWRVPSTGGPRTPLTTLDPAIRAGSHRWPHFLPDARHFVYLLLSGQVEQQGLYVGSIDSGEVIRLVDANSSAAYAPPGYLLFERDGTLLAQAFDATGLKLSGYSSSVADGLGRRPNGYAPFSTSERGGLAYVTSDPRTKLVWFDRSGRELETLAIPAARQGDPALSPDGHQILCERMDPETHTPDIFLFDGLHRAMSRLTSDPSVDVVPIWSGDATRVVYRSNRNGPGDLYLKPLAGNGKEELLLRSDARKDPTDWSRDGRFILYDNWAGQGAARVMSFVPLFGDRKPSPYRHTTFSTWGGRFSPDGRWVAYTANESGTDEVYIQAFPAAGVSHRVSTHGGSEPAWRGDGQELFYLAADGTLTACAIRMHNDVVDVGAPTPLFRPKLGSSSLRNDFDVAPNGERFLITTSVQDETTARITVVLNWSSTLRK